MCQAQLSSHLHKSHGIHAAASEQTPQDRTSRMTMLLNSLLLACMASLLHFCSNYAEPYLSISKFVGKPFWS